MNTITPWIKVCISSLD